ncbi:MAG: TetR/AcrR family transcriptional regulator [Bacteroidales bacterium]|jgi:AcrR family transcriptional regulator|nr:TetR/AcrR family transcriptional regulator [Bacteroidales bacterium]
MDIKEKIIEQMWKELLTKSCKTITMDEIAQNLGISKRTLYENFTGKEDLLEQSIHFYINILDKKIDEDVANAENSLDIIIRIMFRKSEFTKQIDIKQVMDIQKYYPTVFKKLFNNETKWEEGRAKFKVQITNAIKEGFITDSLNVDFILNFVEMNIHHSMDMEYLENNNFYTQNTINILNILIPIRGIATLKGVQFIDNLTWKARDFSHIDKMKNTKLKN